MPQNASTISPDHTLPRQPAARGIAPRLVVVMGVAGSGKSTIAEGLHNELGWPWQDADALHSPESRALMAAGTPLDDTLRVDWLTRCHTWLAEHARHGQGAILACSALRRSYRDRLRAGGLRPLFIALEADPASLSQRLEKRPGHFMPASLLPSQLATLEPLTPDEDGIALQSLTQPAETIAMALHALKIAGRA
ncbi:MAG: gluconokinase, GntK/IdnK-type [Acetobacter papayae]